MKPDHVERTAPRFMGLYVIGRGFIRDWAWLRTWQRQLTLHTHRTLAWRWLYGHVPCATGRDRELFINSRAKHAVATKEPRR